MSGLLLELRRQIAHNRRKAAYEERMRASAQEKPQEVFSQKTKETKPDTEIHHHSGDGRRPQTGDFPNLLRGKPESRSDIPYPGGKSGFQTAPPASGGAAGGLPGGILVYGY